MRSWYFIPNGKNSDWDKMRSRELQEYLAEVTGRTLSEIDQRCRFLRKNQQVRSGPRGLSALHLNAGEAVLHVLSLASEKLRDAADVAKDLAFCVLVAEQPFPDHDKYAAKILKDHGEVRLPLCIGIGMGSIEGQEFDFISFEFAANGSHAWATVLIEGKLVRLLFVCIFGRTFGPAWKCDEFFESERHSAATSFTFGGSHLREIGRRIAVSEKENDAT